MSEQNQQHLKITAKILEKYGNPKTSKLKQWLRKYSELSIEEVNSVIAKFQSFVGYDEERTWDSHEIQIFILVAVAAQKAKNLMDLKEGGLERYKKHSFVISKKTGKQKKIEKERQQSDKSDTLEMMNNKIEQKIQQNDSMELKQSIKIQIKTQQEQLGMRESAEVIKLSKTPTPSQTLAFPSLSSHSNSSNQIDSSSFKKKRSSNVETSKSPAQPPISIHIKSPTRSKHHSNELEQSISTKMQVLDLNGNVTINKLEPETEIAQLPPPICIKPIEKSNSFFESRIEIQNHSLHKKPVTHLQIKINKFHKFTEGWSTVIKYEIITPDQTHANVLRRYSQFSKLHSYLSENYKGVIVPQLPPKEYLKGTIWAADNAFLNDRRVGLELFLNKILAHDVLGQDHLALRFIDDQKLDDDGYGQTGYMQTADKYLKTLLSITKNTSQIKDYGVAYYSYMKSSVVNQVPQQINDLYQQIKGYVEKFTKFKQFVQKMQTIYVQRSQIECQFLELIPTNKQNDEKYKKQINQVSQQFSEAKTAYDGYCKLKAETKWYQLLYETKKSKSNMTKQDVELKSQLEEAERKVKKVTPMLEKEMKEFIVVKRDQLKGLLENFVAWKCGKEGG